MKRVVIESPFAGDRRRNIAYARAAMADCINRGEAPIASHLLYTQPGILRDHLPGERKLGMECGFVWGAQAEKCVVYLDLGMSQGMKDGIARAWAAGIPVEYRSIPTPPPTTLVNTMWLMLTVGMAMVAAAGIWLVLP